MARIFITYRSEDPGWSVALDRELSIVFGPEQVFRASRTMQLGESFPERIRAGIAGASVQLAVIGPRWLEVRSDGRRRIDDPDDWVRREIRLALEAQLLIVPVLVDGVAPLAAEELPEDIRALADRQYIRLGHKEAEADIRLLIERLQRRVPGLRASSPAPPGVSGHDDRPSLWLTLTGLALLLLSLWLPWIDGTRLLETDWHEWEFAMIFPRGLLAIAGSVVAVACFRAGRFEAVATGLVGAGAYVAIVDPLWVRRQFVDDYTSYRPSIGGGPWVALLAGMVLIAAVAAGLQRRPVTEPRHANRSVAVGVGAIIVLIGEGFQIQSHHHWFTAHGSVALLLVVAALLIPPRIPEFTRTAALAGFTMLALISVVAAVNYVWLHRADGASLTDSMGRIVLNVVVALGVWTALSRPGRRSRVLPPRSSTP